MGSQPVFDRGSVRSMAGLLTRIARLAWPPPPATSSGNTVPTPDELDVIPPRRPGVPAAWRQLGLEEGASLDEVRAAYQAQARALVPRTLSPASADAAHAKIGHLTDALEVLEAHLLPHRGAAEPDAGA